MSSLSRVSIRLPELEELPPWEGGFPSGEVMPVTKERPEYVTSVADDALRPEALRLTPRERATCLRAEARIRGRGLRHDLRDLLATLVERVVLAPLALVLSNVRLVVLASLLLLLLGLAADRLFRAMLSPFGG